MILLGITVFRYDHQGQRILKHEPQKNQTTFYISQNFIQVQNSSGTFNTTYYYDGDTLVARTDNPGNKTFFYHPDHLGSATLITNEAGQVVEEITYEPFGKVFSGQIERFGYTGKELDDTGLQYFGARYYCVAESQFCQPDTNLPDPYDPQQLNRYAYSRDNPYKYTDPDGNAISAAIVVAGFGIGGAALSYFTQASTGKVDVGRVYITGGSFAIGAGVGIVASSAIVGGGIATILAREGAKRVIGSVIGGIAQETGLDIALGNTIETYSGTGSEVSTAIGDIGRFFQGKEPTGLYIPPGSEVGPVYYPSTGKTIQNPQEIDIDERIETEKSFILSYLQKLKIDTSKLDVHGLVKAYNTDKKGLTFEEFATKYAENYQ